MRNICSVEGCDKFAYGNGYCSGHYYQYKKYGKILYNELRKETNRSKHKLYSTWLSLKDRCNNPRNKYYHNYGARGIKVCERWQDHANGFENFLADMGERPDGYSIDRIDNNGDYCPENCKWSDKIEQNLNKRTNLSTPYITTQTRNGATRYVVRIKDLRDTTGRTVRTKVRKTLEEAILARDELLKEMKKNGQREPRKRV